MEPKFANMAAWRQAELLMQPVFIRVIDNIRKHLEQSPWKGTYQEMQVWPEETPEETRATFEQLQQRLHAAPPEQAEMIQQQLAQLPQPYPGYLLRLERHNHQATVDLWQLCYQICFLNYPANGEAVGQTVVEVDTSLIDETGDVDWQRLDEKAQQTIELVFDGLPGSDEA